MGERSHTVLSLDLASTLGWCFIKDGIIDQSGVVNLKGKGFHPGDRAMKFYNMLVPFKNINEIFYESAFCAGPHHARVHYGLLAMLEFFTRLHPHIKLTSINAMSIKCEFAGHGHATKEDMCKTAHRLGWAHGVAGTDIDHDEADAIAVAWVIFARRGKSLKFKNIEEYYGQKSLMQE